eukprot:scaffold6506_cov171-Amphora_coffeaeformis.AAC.29
MDQRFGGNTPPPPPPHVQTRTLDDDVATRKPAEMSEVGTRQGENNSSHPASEEHQFSEQGEHVDETAGFSESEREEARDSPSDQDATDGADLVDDSSGMDEVKVDEFSIDDLIFPDEPARPKTAPVEAVEDTTRHSNSSAAGIDISQAQGKSKQVVEDFEVLKVVVISDAHLGISIESERNEDDVAAEHNMSEGSHSSTGIGVGNGAVSLSEGERTWDEQFHSCDEFDAFEDTTHEGNFSETKASWHGSFQNQTFEVQEQSVAESGATDSPVAETDSEVTRQSDDDERDGYRYPETSSFSDNSESSDEERGLLDGYGSETESVPEPSAVAGQGTSDQDPDGELSSESSSSIDADSDIHKDESEGYADLTEDSVESGAQGLAESLNRKQAATEQAKAEAARLEKERVLAARQRGEQMRKEYERQKEERKAAARAKQIEQGHSGAESSIASSRRTEEVRFMAATRIQAVFRGWSAYEFFQIQRDSASVIQAQVRARRVKKQFEQLKREMGADADQLEQKLRFVEKMEDEASEVEIHEVEALDIEACELAATRIQAVFRGWCTAEFFRIQCDAAIDIQSQVRGFQSRKLFYQLKEARKLKFAANKTAAEAKFLEGRRYSATTKIQALYRARSAAAFFSLQRISVAKIQARVRGRQSRKLFQQSKEAKQMKEERLSAERRVWAATRIQTIYRGWIEYEYYLMKCMAVCVIQSHVRGMQSRKEFERKMQARRADMEAKCLEEERLAAEAELKRLEEICSLAATRIQAVYRGWMTANQYVVRRFAIKCIQAQVRVFQTRMEYEQRKALQRATAQTKSLEEHGRRIRGATRIQAACRGWIVAEQYFTKRFAAKFIQAHVRGFQSRKKYELWQSAHRVEVEAEDVRLEEYRILAATQIQAIYRGWTASEYYSLKRFAACVIQAQIRGCQSRKEYTRKLNAKRAKVEAEARRFGKKRLAATKIQAICRGWSASEYYSLKRFAVCIIQAQIRGCQSRKEYTRKLNAKRAKVEAEARRFEEERLAAEAEAIRLEAEKAAAEARRAEDERRAAEEEAKRLGDQRSAAEATLVAQKPAVDFMGEKSGAEVKELGKECFVEQEAGIEAQDRRLNRRPHDDNNGQKDFFKPHLTGQSDSESSQTKRFDVKTILRKLKPNEDQTDQEKAAREEEIVKARTKESSNEETRNLSALKIQTLYRGWVKYEFYGLQRYASTLIQARERGRQVRSKYIERKDALVLLRNQSTDPDRSTTEPNNDDDSTWKVVLSSLDSSENETHDKDLPPLVSSHETSQDHSVSEVSDEGLDDDSILEEVQRLKALSLMIATEDGAVPDDKFLNTVDKVQSGPEEEAENDELKTPPKEHADSPERSAISKSGWGMKIFSKSKDEIISANPGLKFLTARKITSDDEDGGFKGDDQFLSGDDDDSEMSDDTANEATEGKEEESEKSNGNDRQTNDEPGTKAARSKAPWGFTLFKSTSSGTKTFEFKPKSGESSEFAPENAGEGRRGNILASWTEASSAKLEESPMPVEQQPNQLESMEEQRKPLEKEEKSRSTWGLGLFSSKSLQSPDEELEKKKAELNALYSVYHKLTDDDDISARQDQVTSPCVPSKYQISDDMSSEHSEDTAVSAGACRTKALNFLLAGGDDDEEEED